MTICILLVCFVLIFLNLGILANPKLNLKEILLKSVLIFSIILVFITEIASIIHVLNFQFILMPWVGVSVLNMIYLFKNKNNLANFIAIIKQRLKITYDELNKLEKYLVFSVLIILTLIFIQGVVYPPNNWDSMTYHMARIPNWISHESILHYQTHIIRQIYQPPFSEYVILHFNILNSGDYFSNSVQFFFLVFSLFAIVLLVHLFGLNRKYKIIAIILAITIPEVILEASSTQNDIVVAFFILTSIYFAVKSIKGNNIQNYFFLGISVGLGILTKGTAYIYLAPILLIFGAAVLICVFKTKKYSYLRYSIISVLLFLSINSGHFSRNYDLTNNILGVDKNESKMYSNENMSPALLMSNIIKNVGLHLGPYPINRVSNKLIYKLHSLADVDINNSGTNFLNINYSSGPDIPNHEDTASNSIHIFLLFLSFILIGLNIISNKTAISKILLYVIMLLFQIILFCGYLKWQPWHTRLHLPLFMLSMPLICYALSLNKNYLKLFYKATPIIILSAFFVILFNRSRPFLTNRYTSKISIIDNRYKKYFSSRLGLYEEYSVINKNISKSTNTNIGLILASDDWEYPLFSQFYGMNINPVSINVSNLTKDIKLNPKNIDYIISTTLNDTVIDFNGKRFYNIKPKNNSIWLYR